MYDNMILLNIFCSGHIADDLGLAEMILVSLHTTIEEDTSNNKM